ncbi:TPA_asm: uroporphyrinogen decarboxylase, partial [Listeria monocytogenes]|nr:uroporphyrinogen decarboxylase [Listeria monocytogenes]
VKKIRAGFEEDIVAIYNIFAPVTYFKWLVGEVSGGDDLIANFIDQDAATLKKVLDTIGQDIASLSQRIINEAGADGIYLSVQSIQDARVSQEVYKQVIAPSELHVLETAKEAGGVNILHICGYEGARNDIHLFTDYPAPVINWAVGPEGISLAEGREIFGGRTVLGGFENGKTGLLYTGDKAAIQAETKRIIAETGTTGLVIGADCTIPSDIDEERIEWVREAAAE